MSGPRLGAGDGVPEMLTVLQPAVIFKDESFLLVDKALIQVQLT